MTDMRIRHPFRAEPERSSCRSRRAPDLGRQIVRVQHMPERFPILSNRKHALDSFAYRIFHGDPLHTPDQVRGRLSRENTLAVLERLPFLPHSSFEFTRSTK